MASLKRSADHSELPVAKAAKVEKLPPGHPHCILEHLVRVVLPKKCGTDFAKEFYKQQLENPQETVDYCKGKLEDWVVELWEKGLLNHPASIRVKCELVPVGERHPDSVTRNLAYDAHYQGPATRLGIKISGILKANQEESWVWVEMEGDSTKGICRVNRVVDWLEGLDTEELRPRRFYRANENLGRNVGRYTQHPLDVGEEWMTFTHE